MLTFFLPNSPHFRHYEALLGQLFKDFSEQFTTELLQTNCLQKLQICSQFSVEEIFESKDVQIILTSDRLFILRIANFFQPLKCYSLACF